MFRKSARSPQPAGATAAATHHSSQYHRTASTTADSDIDDHSRSADIDGSGPVIDDGFDSDDEPQTAADVSQVILETVSDIYTTNKEGGLGLCEMSRRYGVEEGILGAVAGGAAEAIVPPKKRIWIMLIGNHSAGKSSFINWYLDEPVQKTSVAIETTGFTFITHGKSRETFSGPATIQLFPFLRSFAEMKGVMPSMSTEVVPADVRNFKLLTFIDTPGLVDGEMQYPFDPEESLIRLANHVDLIFNFFDPIGQALCARTMRIVERLCGTHGHKMHFFLSKADTVPDETDRQRVLVQIAQNLTHRIKDRQFSLNIAPIYIPTDRVVPVRNHLHEVLQIVDKTISMGVQMSLQQLEADCKKLGNRIDRRLRDDNRAREFNSRDVGRGCFLLTLALAPIIVWILLLIVRFGDMTGLELEAPDGVIWAVERVDHWVSRLSYRAIGYILACSMVELLLWWIFIKKRRVLPSGERAVMLEHYRRVTQDLPDLHKDLYQDYFDAHMSGQA